MQTANIDTGNVTVLDYENNFYRNREGLSRKFLRAGNLRGSGGKVVLKGGVKVGQQLEVKLLSMRERRAAFEAALLEAIAVAVHLQDMNVMGKPVEQGAGQPLGAEDLGPFLEGCSVCLVPFQAPFIPVPLTPTDWISAVE
jgi:hypothetical protein